MINHGTYYELTDALGTSSCWNLDQLKANNANNHINDSIIASIENAKKVGEREFWYCIVNGNGNDAKPHLYIPLDQRTCLTTASDINCYKGI